MRKVVAAWVLVMASAAAAADGVPIRMLAPTFACRDMSDMIRLGLRMAEGDKAGFLALYFSRQETGACEALRDGTPAVLEDVHDEQGLHLACIRQGQDEACFWAANARFTGAP